MAITLTTGNTFSDGDVLTATKLNNVVNSATVTLATDSLIGRSTAGTGTWEEVTCTAAARSILDDATTAAIGTTLGLGTASSARFGKVGIGVAPTRLLDISSATTDDQEIARIIADLADSKVVYAVVGKAASADSAMIIGYNYDTTAADQYGFIGIYGDSDPLATINFINGGSLGIGTKDVGTNGVSVLAMQESTPPTSSPSGVGQLYVEGGALKYRGAGGTVTTLAAT